MDPRYAAWIVEQYPTPTAAMNRCFGATRDMVAAFPELRRVRGWYGWTEHWWCVSLDGGIVDPTAAQFHGTATYREFRDGVDPEPLGKCVNCGLYSWPYVDGEGEPVGKDVPGAIATDASSGTCSAACERSYLAYLNRETG